MTSEFRRNQIMRPCQVEILLSTYNGERFIVEQLESILAQTNREWRILIRDDGSADRCRDICLDYHRRHPEHIHLVEDRLGNLGLVGSFGRLLLQSSAPYVMFCDQDDCWLPGKIELQLREIKRLECLHGSGKPIAVFTDAQVVDSDLRPVFGSLLRYINRRGDQGRTLNRLCVEGNCYGCTMILNRALVLRIGRMPAGVISHDWWAGLVAASFGVLGFLDCAPIKHRRHANNASATKQNSWLRYLRTRPSLEQHRVWINRVFAQCEAFAGTYSTDLPAKAARLFGDLSRVRRAGWFTRRLLVLRHRVRMTGLGRNLGFLLAI